MGVNMGSIVKGNVGRKSIRCGLDGGLCGICVELGVSYRPIVFIPLALFSLVGYSAWSIVRSPHRCHGNLGLSGGMYWRVLLELLLFSPPSCLPLFFDCRLSALFCTIFYSIVRFEETSLHHHVNFDAAPVQDIGKMGER